MMRFFRFAALLLPLCAGCVSVDYVGQTFPERPAGSHVVFFPNLETVPQGYRMIGRGTVSAPESYTAEDVKDLLLEKGEAVGANAVAVASFQKELVSVNFVPHEEQDSVSDWNNSAVGLSPNGSRLYTDTFGESMTMDTRQVKRYQVVIHARFLVDETRYLAVMNKQDEKRVHEQKLEQSDRTLTAADVMAEEKKLSDAREARCAARWRKAEEKTATESAPVPEKPSAAPAEK